MRCLNTRKITSDPDDAISEIRDKSVTIVDVRRPEEYKKNHIHSAVNLPLSELLSDDSPERVAKLVGAIGIDDSMRTIIYDDTFGAQDLGHGHFGQDCMVNSLREMSMVQVIF